ncbi:hypothetical protein CJF31_00000599 [Rutstroemia sp. NJR-2017a BVV2]|nr:hypothetical protein CJF31_00000599 [Rutstroemia sp. NJR-2017a BVV2]
MSFPRQAAVAEGSVYRAYGNAQMMLDGSNQTPPSSYWDASENPMRISTCLRWISVR